MQLGLYKYLVLCWFIGVTFTYLLGWYLGYVSEFPTSESLVSFDSHFYRSIFQDGYHYDPTVPCSVGFFPFFSFVWWGVGGSPLVISIFNVLFFTISLRYLLKDGANDLLTLVLLSFPSMFFIYVAYSEALFFVFGTFILLGLKNNLKWLVFIGLFFASMTRPSFLFFIPAFGILFLVELRDKKLSELLTEYIIYYGIPILLGIAIVLLIHKHETGNLFAYFEVQQNVWSRNFKWPRLPFGSTKGKTLLWIDAIGFWVGCFVTILIAVWSFNFLKNRKSDFKYKRAVIFSVAYLLMSFLSIVFFNPRWGIGRTVLNGLNRYMFVNPFFFFAIYHLAKNLKLKPIHYLAVSIFSLFTWLFLENNYFLDISYVIYFACITLYILTFILFLQTKNLFLFGSLILVNLVGQVYLFDRYINGLWVG